MVVADLSGKVLARTKSERDGFYSFDEVPAGADCVVLPDPKYLEKWNLTATPRNILISVPKKGEFKSGVSFTLTRR